LLDERGPDWLVCAQVNDQICKFAKKGQTPSQIGVLLRDSMGIPQVSSVTGSKILRILKASGLAPEIPEDLYHLIKKAVAMRKHLERNRKDKDGKFRLILVESRIHRLARYYKVRLLPSSHRRTGVDLSRLCSACARCLPPLGTSLPLRPPWSHKSCNVRESNQIRVASTAHEDLRLTCWVVLVIRPGNFGGWHFLSKEHETKSVLPPSTQHLHQFLLGCTGD
jgi:small subunit ribosomal protein S13e